MTPNPPLADPIAEASKRVDEYKVDISKYPELASTQPADAGAVLEKGAYVLATKWEDGEPLDHWCVGNYDRFEHGRHYVTDNEGNQYRGNGFRRVAEISEEYGEFLIKNKDRISPRYVEQVIVGSLWDTETTIRHALSLSAASGGDE